MDTILRLQEVDQRVERTPAVDAFLDTLRKEQDRYLAAVRQAASVLRREPGQLGCVAASHGRLTQQFFDAQRLILSRRADVDTEVAHVGLAAEAHADAMVRAARTKAIASGTIDRVTVVKRVRPAAPELNDGVSRSARQEIAALGASVVHTTAEAEALAGVINAAFEPEEPDGAAAQRQLAALLDEWWTAENHEGRAAIDDAHARAAMRRHVASVQAGEIFPEGEERDELAMLEQAVVSPSLNASPVQLLPTQVLDVLEHAGSTELAQLLSTLAASLTPTRVAPAPAAHALAVAAPARPVVDGLVIRLDVPVIDVESTESAPEEAFRRFWSKGSDSVDRKHSLGWIPLRVVVPMAGAMSAIALLMALVG
ncbi:MAG: hypothetical protein JWN39_2418 [Ilumatobacteraceae bacterium]|nr:hypothetical protein [Ilumatobacteraceae bacterium]